MVFKGGSTGSLTLPLPLLGSSSNLTLAPLGVAVHGLGLRTSSFKTHATGLIGLGIGLLAPEILRVLTGLLPDLLTALEVEICEHALPLRQA